MLPTSMHGRPTTVKFFFTQCSPTMDAQLLNILDFQDAKAYYSMFARYGRSLAQSSGLSRCQGLFLVWKIPQW